MDRVSSWQRAVLKGSEPHVTSPAPGAPAVRRLYIRAC